MIFSNEDKTIIKRLIKYLKPFRLKITLLILCTILTAGINLVMPFIGKEIFDKGLMVKDFDIVFKLSLLTMALVILDQALGLVETRFYSYINTIFPFNLSRLAFNHLLKIRIDFFKNSNTNEILSQIGMDIGNVNRITDQSMFFIVTQVFRMAGGTIGLFLIDWRLTLLVLVVVPVKYFFIKWLAAKRKSLFEEFIELNRDYAAWYGDVTAGIKEIKLWNTAKIENKIFVKKQRKLIKKQISMAFIDKFNELFENILIQFIINGLYIIGAYFVINNGLTIGSLFAFITYSVFLTGPISAILNIGYNFSGIIPSAKRFFHFLEMETEENPVQININKIITDTEEIIRFDNISFTYPNGNPALNNINLSIKKNEKIALIGDNGSGKSTIINLLLGFYSPASGGITINGKDTREFRINELRALFTVVSQDIHLFNVSLMQNISMFSKQSESAVKKALEQSGAANLLEKLPGKLDTITGTNGAKVSGGERQKIAIARAMIKDAPVVIFDEATSNLDADSEKRLCTNIETYFKNKTMIFITHRPELLKIADRVFIIEKGSIKESGTHEELINKSEFYRNMINKEDL